MVHRPGHGGHGGRGPGHGDAGRAGGGAPRPLAGRRRHRLRPVGQRAAVEPGRRLHGHGRAGHGPHGGGQAGEHRGFRLPGPGRRRRDGAGGRAVEGAGGRLPRALPALPAPDRQGDRRGEPVHAARGAHQLPSPAAHLLRHGGGGEVSVGAADRPLPALAPAVRHHHLRVGAVPRVGREALGLVLGQRALHRLRRAGRRRLCVAGLPAHARLPRPGLPAHEQLPAAGHGRRRGGHADAGGATAADLPGRPPPGHAAVRRRGLRRLPPEPPLQRPEPGGGVCGRPEHDDGPHHDHADGRRGGPHGMGPAAHQLRGGRLGLRAGDVRHHRGQHVLDAARIPRDEGPPGAEPVRAARAAPVRGDLRLPDPAARISAPLHRHEPVQHLQDGVRGRQPARRPAGSRQRRRGDAQLLDHGRRCLAAGAARQRQGGRGRHERPHRAL